MPSSDGCTRPFWWTCLAVIDGLETLCPAHGHYPDTASRMIRATAASKPPSAPIAGAYDSPKTARSKRPSWPSKTPSASANSETTNSGTAGCRTQLRR